MKFVELTLSPSRRYAYRASSDIQMNILGDFLASDVGYRSLPFKQWVYNDNSNQASGCLTFLQKKTNFIFLFDFFAKDKSKAFLQITCEQFIQILDDWQEIACNIQPDILIIEYADNQFTIKTKILTEEDLFPVKTTIPAHVYPLWIKVSLAVCCIICIVCFSQLPNFLALRNQIKKAHYTFNSKNYTRAIQLYSQLHDQYPHAESFKLYLAYALFRTNDKENHKFALSLLEKIRFNDREWKELLQHMPVEYISCFKYEKKNKNKKDKK